MVEYKHFVVRKDSDLVKEVLSCDGRNDEERLKNWAEGYSSDKSFLDEDDVREIVRDEVVLEALK